MAGLLQDVRFALRQLRKDKTFTATAAVMLALGICANTTVFSWINGTMLHPIPGAFDTGQLVSMMRGEPSLSPPPPLSYPDYRDLRERNRNFNGILAFHHDWLTLTAGVMPERIYVANVSDNYFDVLGVRPLLGRFFLQGEEIQKGGLPYVVLSYSLWQNRFGGDRAVVGKTIEVARKQGTVIGVAPRGFLGAMPGIRQDAWIPLDPGVGTDDRMQSRSRYWLNVIGRLKPGVSRERAHQEMNSLMNQIVAQYPKEHQSANQITLDPMWRSPFGANVYMAASLPILLCIAGVVLLLTCVNVATLALVRFVSRRREVAIREALGAGRAQIMRQMVIEGVAVSLLGGLLALLLTLATSRAFARFVPPNANPVVVSGLVDHTIVIMVVLLAVAASAICGALPAWRSSQVPSAEVLKEETGNIAGGHNRHMLSGLVVTQIALSLSLLVCSGLFLRTLHNLSDANPGFNEDHVLTATVGIGISGYSSAEESVLQQKILAKVSALPAVKASTLTDWLPLSLTSKDAEITPEGYIPQARETRQVQRSDVGPGYFKTMGIPLLAGREFTAEDNGKNPRVAVVNQTAARHYWPGQDAIGRHLTIWGHAYTVVGVARDIKRAFLNERPSPMVFLSYYQHWDETVVMVQTAGDPHAIAPAIEEAVHQVDGRLPVYDVRTLRETTQISNTFAILESTFASILAVITLILAGTGIYGVVAYRTQLRTHEIGIRMALGAGRAQVLRMVLWQGTRLIAIGLVFGVALVVGLTRFLAALLYGISPNDPVTLIVVLTLLGLVGLAACYLPALRAMRVNPVTAMRVN